MTPSDPSGDAPATPTETSAEAASSPLDGEPVSPEGDVTDPGLMPEPAVPRLPVPGMLRDGAGPRPDDFRETPRARPGPAKVAAMAPPPGVMAPPKLGAQDESEGARLRPGDTAAFMAQVAAELMQEEAQGSTIHGVAVEILDDEEVGANMSGAALPVPPAAPTPAAAMAAAASAQPAAESIVPLPTSAPPPRAASATSKRRGVLMGLALVGGVGLVLLVWVAVRGDPPTETKAAAPADAAVADADPTPADSTSGTPEPVAVPPDPPVAALASTGADASTGGGSTGADGSTGAGSTTTGDGSESTGDPSDDDEGDDGSDPVASAPSSRGSSRSRPRNKDKPSPSPAPTPTPTSTPKPTPEAPPDAAKLLAQARAAYNSGRGSTAYSLASRSHRVRKSSEAGELMTLAACAMKDTNKAKAALKKVALLRRPSIRSQCKSKHGVKLGL